MKKSNVLFLNSFPLSILYICMYMNKIDKGKELIMNSMLLFSYQLVGIYISGVVRANQTSKIRMEELFVQKLNNATS